MSGIKGIPSCDLQEGDIVNHQKYGNAIVTKVRRNSSNTEWICEVRWDVPIEIAKISNSRVLRSWLNPPPPGTTSANVDKTEE